MAKKAQYWCVEHEYRGETNCVAFTDEERAISYAAKMHVTCEPLYKASDFMIEDVEEEICFNPEKK